MKDSLGLGHFWRQSKPESTVAGNLFRLEDGSLEIEILGNLNLQAGSIELGQFPDGDSICGLVNNRFYRFLEPWQTGMQIRMPGPSSETWISGMAVSSYDQMSILETSFDSAQIGLTGMEQLLGLRATNQGSMEETGSQARVFKPQELISYESSFAGGQVVFAGQSTETHSARRSVEYSLDLSLTIKYTSPASIWKIASDFERISNLVALVTCCTHVPSRELLLLGRDSRFDFTEGRKLPLVLDRRRTVSSPGTLPHHEDLLIDLSPEALTKLACAWIEIGQQFDAPSTMVLSRLQNRIRLADVGLILNASALESLHRLLLPELIQDRDEFKRFRRQLGDALPTEYRDWFMAKTESANRKSLRMRLGELAELTSRSLASDVLRSPALLDDLRNYRNAVTHQDQAEPLDSNNLFPVMVLAGHLATVIMLSKALETANLDNKIKTDRLTRTAINARMP